MALGKRFEAFALQSPVTVMVRGVLQYALSRERLDELFRQHAEEQYEDALLFSTVVRTLALAVCGVRKSVHAAYQACVEEFTVSVTSLYNKLQGTEIQVSRALVRETAERLEPVISVLKATLPAPLRGYRVKILDGNHLSGTQHRIKETRTLNSSPLPGHALVVLDPQRMLAIDVFPCEDAYAQERSLSDDVLQTVQAGDVWMADRNFCTTRFLFGLRERDAYFVIREHASTLSGKTPVGRRRRVGRSDTGTVYEQTLRIANPKGDEVVEIRRTTVKLDHPMRDGDHEINILANLPKPVSAMKIAAAYRQRWTIENAFQELGQALESEIDTLCYPKATLLCFCVALYTYNVMSVVKAALRAVHDEEAAVDRISGYYLAEEVAAVYGGMMIAIPPRYWNQAFGLLTTRQMANTLKALAGNVRLRQFRKHVRGPKKPPPKRHGGYREKHVSTARLLEQRKR